MIRYCFTTPQPPASDFGSRSAAVWAQGNGMGSNGAQGQGYGPGATQNNGLLDQAVLSYPSPLELANLFLHLPNLRVGLQDQMQSPMQAKGHGLDHRTDCPIWVRPISAGLEQQQRSGRYRCPNGSVPQQD